MSIGLRTSRQIADNLRTDRNQYQRIKSKTFHTGEPPHRLRFRQESSPLPDDAESFSPTVLHDLVYDIYGVVCYWKDVSESDFSVELHINGSSQVAFEMSYFPTLGEVFPFPNIIRYDENKQITTKIISSTDMEELEIIYIMKLIR